MMTKLVYFAAAVFLAAGCYASAQSTAFAYQGQLNDGANPANGSYEFRFQIWNAAEGGSEMYPTPTYYQAPVSNGLFTATLDFGFGFDGSERWLEIAVKTNGGGGFSTLTPRQRIFATPYAITAAKLSGSIDGGSITAGSIADAGLSSNVALRSGGNTFSGVQAMNGALNVNSPGFPSATAIVRGRVADEFPFAAQSYSGANLLLVRTNGQVDISGALNAASFTGSGSGLTSLGAASIASGTLADTRLSANVALRAGGNTFSGQQTLNGDLKVDGFYSGSGDFRLHAFQGEGLNGSAFVQARDTSGNTSIDLVLRSQSNGVPVDVARFKANGLTTLSGPLTVGGPISIATTTPGFPLSFASSLGEKISLYGTSGSSFGFGIQPGLLQIHSDLSGNDVAIGNGSGADMAETARFKGNGLVGLGVTTPEATLHLRPRNGLTQPLRVDSILGKPVLEVTTNAVIYVTGSFYASEKMQVSGEITTTAINLTSDRNAKEAFQPVDARQILEKVARLPISEWQYRSRVTGDAPDGARHIGPMAQDFHEAFALGHDDRHITSVDADGVALAAIQGLNEKLDERTREVEALRQQVAELHKLVSRLAPPVER